MRLPYFDILSPIDLLIGMARHGKMHRFTFDANSGFNGYRVEKLLRQYGIRVWGRQIHDSKRSFVVKETQAVWAEYVLCRAGVPIEGRLLDPKNREYSQNHPVDSMPHPWTANGVPAISLIDHFGEWLGRLLGE